MSLDDGLATIVGAVIVALAGGISWTAQQTARRRAIDRERREHLYRQLMSAVLDMSACGNAAPLVVEVQQAWLYASDEVLMAVNSYLRFYLSRIVEPGSLIAEEDRQRIQWFEAEIRLSVRRDLMPTRLSREWIESEWVAVAAPPDKIEEYRKAASEPRSFELVGDGDHGT